MNCLSLNIRGFGGDVKVKKLRELLRKEDIGFLTVQETSLTGDAAFISNLIWKHSYWNFCQTPSSGRSGGLLCIWNSTLFSAQNIISGPGFLAVEGVWQGCSNSVFLWNVYGPQEASAKKVLWGSLCL